MVARTPPTPNLCPSPRVRAVGCPKQQMVSAGACPRVPSCPLAGADSLSHLTLTPPLPHPLSPRLLRTSSILLARSRYRGTHFGWFPCSADKCFSSRASTHLPTGSQALPAPVWAPKPIVNGQSWSGSPQCVRPSPERRKGSGRTGLRQGGGFCQ